MYRAFSLTWLALCKSIGTKGSIYVRKDFNSHRIGLVCQYGRRFIVFGTPIWPPWRHMKTLYRFAILNLAKSRNVVEIWFKLKEVLKFKNCSLYKEMCGAQTVWLCSAGQTFISKNRKIQSSKFPQIWIRFKERQIWISLSILLTANWLFSSFNCPDVYKSTTNNAAIKGKVWESVQKTYYM